MSKIQIQFSPNEQKVLDALRGTRTIASAVRDAIIFYDWCRRQMADGFTIVAMKGDVQREPLLPFPKKE